jgi:hypothetical protein
VIEQTASLSTPFWEFPLAKKYLKVKELEATYRTFYSLLGVSRFMVVRTEEKGKDFLLPFGSFHEI